MPIADVADTKLIFSRLDPHEKNAFKRACKKRGKTMVWVFKNFMKAFTRGDIDLNVKTTVDITRPKTIRRKVKRNAH